MDEFLVKFIKDACSQTVLVLSMQLCLACGYFGIVARPSEQEHTFAVPKYQSANKKVITDKFTPNLRWKQPFSYMDIAMMCFFIQKNHR